jgi:amidase
MDDIRHDPPMDPRDLAYAGVARQAALIRSGEVSPVELVELCLRRIERLEPRLNAFRIVFAERALAEARNAEGRRGAGGDRPLLGVPVAVKDNLDMAGELTTMGSNAYGGPAQADAEVVRRLKAAGAIVVGKTMLSELAIFPWTETAAWGMTRNPWAIDERTAGGSSGGSGSVVAAGLVAGATASDGGGSIRIPASVAGLFGLKPQRGRVSLLPDAQHWHGLSQSGCVTRQVLDTALWLDAVAGPAPGDAHSAPAPSRSFVEAATSAPGKLRIAVSTKPAVRARIHPLVRRAVEETAETLRSLGHDVREADPEYGLLEPLFFPRWSAGVDDDMRALPHPERLERRTKGVARIGRLLRGEPLRRALAGEAARARQINRIFDDHDLLLTPTLPMPPWELGKYEGRSLPAALMGASEIVGFTSVWNMTGQPAASLPAAVTDGGVPIGVQLVSRPNDEPAILSVAAQLEAEIGWPDRRPPIEPVSL